MEEVDVDGQEGLTMTPDETSQTIKYVLRNDSLIRVDTAKVYMAVGDETGAWTGFGDHINQMSPETMTIAAPPADAEVTKYLMTYSADGGDLDPAKLYYNIYFDNDLFTFRKSEYTKLPEDEITDMPYGYSDKWDIFSYGNKRSMYFYKSDYTSFGVQALYKDGDTVYRSNIVRYGELDGISATETANAKSMEYTDLCGRKVKSPSTSIYIMTTKFADGTKKSVKLIR